MRANQFIKELAYPGNIGMMEFVKFQKIATPEQKVRMKFLLSTDKVAAWNLLKQVTDTELQEEIITEIDMSPSNLRKLAADTGAVAGMEFEMVVTDVENIDDEQVIEPDFSSDDRVSSFQGIEDFFMADGEWNSRREVQRLMDRIKEDYNEWASEKQSELWQDERLEFFRNEMENEFDFKEAQKEAILDVVGERPEESGKKVLVAYSGYHDYEKYDYQSNVDYEKKIEDNEDAINEKVREMFDEFVEEQWDEQGRLYQDAYDSWMSDTDLPDESDFFEERNLRWMRDINIEYEGYITWPYYTQIEDEDKLDFESIANNYSEVVSKPVNFSRKYHGGQREPNKYVVEPDSSISADEGGSGLEFVSPPLPIDEMLSDLQKTIKWAKSNGYYTNSSTGLHMNVSIPGKNVAFMDFVKLALLLGDNYVLEQFGREANSYAKSALDKVKDQVKYYPESAQKLMDEMRKGLGAIASKAIASSDGFGKYTSINPKEGYVEFRSPGGDWLNEDIGKLTNTLLRFVVALDASLDPEKYRKEYLKKLYQLLQPKSNEDPLAYFAQYSAGMLPKSSLKNFIKQTQLTRNIKAGKPQAQGKNWWLVKQIGGAGSIEVVASNEQEAKARARASWEISIPDNSLEAKPVRAYDLDTQRNELTAPQDQQDIRQFEVFSVDQPNRRIGVFTSTQDNARTKFRQFLSGMDINSPTGLGYRDIT